MKHNGLERNIVFVIILYKLMLSMWYVMTSVTVNEHSHQRLRKPFPVHPGVPLLHVQTAFSQDDVLGCLKELFHYCILKVQSRILGK